MRRKPLWAIFMVESGIERHRLNSAKLGSRITKEANCKRTGRFIGLGLDLLYTGVGSSVAQQFLGLERGLRLHESLSH